MNIQTTKDLITITRIVDGVTNRAEILTHLYDIDGNESLKSRAQLERDLRAPGILDDALVQQITQAVLSDMQD